MDAKQIRQANLKLLVKNFANNNKSVFADKYNMNESHIGQMLMSPEKKTARNVGDKMARKIEIKLDLPYGALDSLLEFNHGHATPGKVPAYKIVTYSDADDLDPDKYVLVPLLDMSLAAGNGDAVPDYVETKRRLAFSREWMDSKGHKPESMRIMAVRGESMEPMLNEGDIVLVDTSNRHIVDGKVYALMFGQEARIKRLKLKYDGSVVIMSDNPAPEYADESVPTSDQDTLHIIGRAVHRSGDI